MSQTNEEAVVRSQMSALHAAFREGDVATLERVMADDFTFSDPSGPVMSKQRWLRDIALGNLIFESGGTGPVEVKRVNDRLVVDGEAQLRVRYTEGNYTGRFRYLGVFRRDGGEWRLELTSAQRLADDAEAIKVHPLSSRGA
jgi:ketosteroid isomerase-like protein